MDNYRRCKQGMFADVPLQLRKSLQAKLQMSEGKSEVHCPMSMRRLMHQQLLRICFPLDTCELMDTREYDL